jgi:hypothetical protein
MFCDQRPQRPFLARTVTRTIMEIVGFELSLKGGAEFPQVEMRGKGDPGRGNSLCKNRRAGKAHGAAKLD